MPNAADQPASSREKTTLCAVVAMTVLIAAYVAWRMIGSPITGIDDAQIFFVYARNFIHGHGIVYSVGGEHVEGFTSFLYFLLCSAVFRCSHSPEIVLLVINLIFTILTSLLIAVTLIDLADKLSLPRSTRLLLVAAYCLWIAWNPVYFVWMTSTLLDTSLYTLIVTASYALLARILLAGSPPSSSQTRWFSLLLICTVLVRPEGSLWVLLQFAAFAAIVWQRAPTRRDALRSLSLPLACLVIAPSALLLFRMSYFGYPLPNTFYAKVSASIAATLGDGKRYFLSFEHFYGLLIFLPLGIVVVWLAITALRKNFHTLLFGFTLFTATFIVTGLLIPVLEGGDHFPTFRMYQSIYPLLFMSLLLPALLLPWLASLRGRVAYFVVLAVLISFFATNSWSLFKASNLADLPPKMHDLRMTFGFQLARSEFEDGQQLHRILLNNLPSVGLAAAGGFAYGYNGTVYDLLGLNDTRMAHADRIKVGPKGHQSFNKRVFYQLAPDLLLPTVAPSSSNYDFKPVQSYYLSTASFDNKIFRGIFNDSQFQSTYTLARVSSDANPGFQCIGFFNNAYLQRLETTPGFHIEAAPH